MGPTNSLKVSLILSLLDFQPPAPNLAYLISTLQSSEPLLMFCLILTA